MISSTEISCQIKNIHCVAIGILVSGNAIGLILKHLLGSYVVSLIDSKLELKLFPWQVFTIHR